MFEKLAEIIWKMLEPKIAEVAEEAYKRGAEDVLRRFGFVYEEVRRIAREDAYAEAGAIHIEDVEDDLNIMEADI